MDNILGVDLGNYATKTSKGVVFDSKVTVGHKELNKNDIKIEYLGKKYTVGSGTRELGQQRYFSDFYNICLLTAIAESYPKQLSINVNIVMGLPPVMFESSLKQELEVNLNKLGTKTITVNGKEKQITINKAAIFSESAIVFSSPSEYKTGKTLIIDIGGGSCDISEFKGLKLLKNTTTKLGILTLLENMRQKFNSTERVSWDSDLMEDLISEDSTIVKGEKANITYLNDTINEYISEICGTLNQNFDTESTRIILIGGGASKLLIYFKKYYPNVELANDNQIINAKTYAAVGEMLWSE